MLPTADQLQEIFAGVVRHHLSDGGWEVVAVAPVRLLSPVLQQELRHAVGRLEDPVLVIVDRAVGASAAEPAR